MKMRKGETLIIKVYRSTESQTYEAWLPRDNRVHGFGKTPADAVAEALSVYANAVDV